MFFDGENHTIAPEQFEDVSGPISDRRIIGDHNDRVSFWARSKNKASGNRACEFEFPGKEFVRRWSMHILPKGYTRSRCYGGFHGRKRKNHLIGQRHLAAQLPVLSAPKGLNNPAQGKPHELCECGATLGHVATEPSVEDKMLHACRRPAETETFRRWFRSRQTTVLKTPFASTDMIEFS